MVACVEKIAKSVTSFDKSCVQLEKILESAFLLTDKHFCPLLYSTTAERTFLSSISPWNFVCPQSNRNCRSEMYKLLRVFLEDGCVFIFPIKRSISSVPCEAKAAN